MQTHLLALMAFSGKVRLEDNPHRILADLLHCHPRTIQRHFNWLQERGWIGKDEDNGWLFFRGLDFISEREGYNKRAVAMQIDDIFEFKAFAITAAISTIIAYFRHTETESTLGGSEQFGWAVSARLLGKWLRVSRRTAVKLRQIAVEASLMTMRVNLWQLEDITPKDVKTIKDNSISTVTAGLFGKKAKGKVSANRLRVKRGRVFAQMPNLCKPQRVLKSR